MSLNTTHQQPKSTNGETKPQASPNLRIACFEDFPQIQSLERAHDLETQPQQDWLSLWTTNPLWPTLQKDWPIGWVLEDATKKIVGSVINIPSLYRFKGRDILCSNGRAWVCAPEYRGFAVWLMDEYFNQPNVDLFLNTTVGANAKQTIASYSEPVPAGDWQSIVYFIATYTGFAQKALRKKDLPLPALLSYPAGLALWLKDKVTSERFPEAPPNITIELIQQFDERFDAFWQELERQNPNKLLAARDRQSLNWHFGIPMRRGKLWIATATRASQLRAYAILKLKHYEIGLRRMELVDYQTLDEERDLLPALTLRALKHAAAGKCDILEHVGCDLPKTRAFDALAPYRRETASWPYFYHAPDDDLATDLKTPETWDPSTYDGDASFE
jgi:hypothetical protein